MMLLLEMKEIKLQPFKTFLFLVREMSIQWVIELGALTLDVNSNDIKHDGKGPFGEEHSVKKMGPGLSNSGLKFNGCSTT